MRPATTKEIDNWDQLVAANPDGGNVLQSLAWAQIKRSHGWRPSHLIAEIDQNQYALLLLRRKILGLGDLGYVPKGPGIIRAEHLGQIVLQAQLEDSPFLLKIEPEIEEAGVNWPAWQKAGIFKAAQDIQINRSTIVVNLAQNEEQLIASFKPKTRYNVRLAEKKGVRVLPVEATNKNCEAMYRLLNAALSRADFVVRQKSYYFDSWQTLASSGNGQLFFATHQNEVLAGAFVSSFAKKAWYKDGGSTKRHTSLMAPYLLQWEIMRWLIGHGFISYDLVGIPPAANLDDSHPLWGLYRFKSGFSSDVRHHVGTLDVPLSKSRYKLWNAIGERATIRVNSMIKHDLFY